MNSPCLNCNNRLVGCHSNCQSYILFKDKTNEEYQLKQCQKKLDNYFAERIIRSMDLGYKTSHTSKVMACSR